MTARHANAVSTFGEPDDAVELLTELIMAVQRVAPRYGRRIVDPASDMA